MKYIKETDDKYIEFDEAKGRAKTIFKSEVSDKIDRMKVQVTELEQVLNDSKALLKWAKREYPVSSGLLRLKDRLEDEVNKLKEMK